VLGIALAARLAADISGLRERPKPGDVTRPERAGCTVQSSVRWLWERRDSLLFTATVGLLAAGIAGYVLDIRSLAMDVWVAAILLGLIYSTVTIATALRRHQPSVDVIAWLALLGALLVDEAFAGAVVAVMLGTGAVLESRAVRRRSGGGHAGHRRSARVQGRRARPPRAEPSRGAITTHRPEDPGRN
jgi:cation transport ATPase